MEDLLDRAADLLASSARVLVLIGSPDLNANSSISALQEQGEEIGPELRPLYDQGITTLKRAWDSAWLRQSPHYLWPFLCRVVLGDDYSDGNRRQKTRIVAENVRPAVARMPTRQELYLRQKNVSFMDHGRRGGETGSATTCVPTSDLIGDLARAMEDAMQRAGALAVSPSERQPDKAALLQRLTFEREKAQNQPYADLWSILQRKRHFLYAAEPDGKLLQHYDHLDNRFLSVRGDFRELQCGACGCVWPAAPVLKQLNVHVDEAKGQLRSSSNAMHAMEAVTRVLAEKVNAHSSTARTNRNTAAPGAREYDLDYIPLSWKISASKGGALSYPEELGEKREAKRISGEDQTHEARSDSSEPRPAVHGTIRYDPDWRCFLPVCPGCGRTGCNVGPNVALQETQGEIKQVLKQQQDTRGRDSYENFLEEARIAAVAKGETLCVLEISAEKGSPVRAETKRVMEKLCVHRRQSMLQQAALIRVNAEHWSVPGGCDIPLRLEAGEALGLLRQWMRGKRVVE